VWESRPLEKPVSLVTSKTRHTWENSGDEIIGKAVPQPLVDIKGLGGEGGEGAHQTNPLEKSDRGGQGKKKDRRGWGRWHGEPSRIGHSREALKRGG